MAVLTRSALEASPLADLHLLASELGIDGYRRLRKADLIGTIIEHQGGEAAEEPEADGAPVTDVEADADADEKPKRRRGTRGGRARKRDADPEGEDGVTDEGAGEGAAEEDEAPAPPKRRSRSRKAAAAPEEAAEPAAASTDSGSGDRVATGTVELLANGSGFLRTAPPEPSDDDVYISAAQVRRCELVAGDEVAGPVREPRRSERYPSLIRIDTINGRPADEVAEGTHFDDLPCALPSERLALGAEDPTLKAIEWLTPIGRGSRATIVGPEHAGKTEALRRLAGALAGQDGLEIHVVLAGARPEEVAEWKAADGPEPVAALSSAASGDAQAQAVERAVDTAKRVAARGGHVVVLVDSVDALPPGAARRALSAARNIVDGGSLTIVATASAPVGGETTIVALDRDLTRTGRFPALDLVASGTVRPELLVGDAGAEAIAKARASALGA